MTDEPTAPREPLSPDPFDGEDWAGSERIAGAGETQSADGTPVRQRVRVRRKINRRRRRVVRWGSAIVGGTLLLAVGWMLYSGLAAKSQLETVRDLEHKLRAEINAGELSDARLTADQISSHARHAYDLTSDPLWRLAAHIPLLGTPIESARTLTSGVNTLAVDALPALVDASKSIDPSTLRLPDGAINLKPIEQVQPTLAQVTRVLNRVLVNVQHAPSDTWLGAVNTARKDALAQLTPLIKTISSADLAVQVVPELLGAAGHRSYMLAFENEAELRGTGGLAGAFAIMSADNGTLSFDRFEPDGTLDGISSGLDLGPDFDHTYNAPDVTGDHRDANTSPNFPYAGQIWAAEWKKLSGQTLDGVVALNPTALSYLLKVTGPAKLPKGSVVDQVTASNVVELTQQRAYADFGRKEKAERKKFLFDVVRASSSRLLSRTGNTTALVRAAGRAAAEHRLLFWSADPSIESLLAPTSIAGATPVTTAPYAQVAINNDAANKLDYYTHASLSWRAAGCGPQRRVTVTITVTNDAPTGLSQYVLGDTGKPGFPKNPGDNRLLVGYYGTAGGQLAGVLVNNDQSTAQVGHELGHPVFTVELDLPRGSTQVIVLSLDEAGSGTPIVSLQPMVNPMTATTAAPSC